jgi:hypothetical protein
MADTIGSTLASTTVEASGLDLSIDSEIGPITYYQVCIGTVRRLPFCHFCDLFIEIHIICRFLTFTEAWNVEHGRSHHFSLNEKKDPDLVQRNLEFLRNSAVPLPAKYAAVAFFMAVWKSFYYASNSYKELKVSQWNKEGKELPKDFNPDDAVTVVSLLDPSQKALQEVVNPLEFALVVLSPMILSRFVAIPAFLCLIPGIGPALAANALINLILADILTNVHSFITIVTNHAGDDLYTFDDGVKPKTGSFYVRQIVGSANYAAGSDPIDFAHGWLNYQVLETLFNIVLCKFCTPTCQLILYLHTP